MFALVWIKQWKHFFSLLFCACPAEHMPLAWSDLIAGNNKKIAENWFLFFSIVRLCVNGDNGEIWHLTACCLSDIWNLFSTQGPDMKPKLHFSCFSFFKKTSFMVPDLNLRPSSPTRYVLLPAASTFCYIMLPFHEYLAAKLPFLLLLSFCFFVFLMFYVLCSMHVCSSTSGY